MFSSAVDDVVVRVTNTAGETSDHSITTRIPHSLDPGMITNLCDGTWGYLTLIRYTILDQLGTALSTDVPLNEQWTTSVVADYSGTNWRRDIERGMTSVGGSFADSVGGENLSLPPTPTPTCNGNTQPIQHWGQSWQVGSLTIGAGVGVQTNTLRKMLGIAGHTIP